MSGAGERGENLVILVADDDEGMRTFVARVLEKAGYTVLRAERGDDAAATLEHEAVDLLVSDVRMPGLDGLKLAGRFRQQGGRCVLMTGYGTIPHAVEATRRGVEAYLTKPVEKEQLLLAVGRAVERVRLDREMLLMRRLLRESDGYCGLIGRSPAMLRLFRAIERAAKAEGNALICGPSGSGKELVARAVHRRSPRAEAPFVAVACGALSPQLAAAELFGAKRGAFTGAESDRRGALERAGEGTLLLDGVEELPLEVQAPLARALERRDFLPVGGTEPVPLRARILAATTEKRGDLKARPTFRRELAYALDILPIDVPGLDRRRSDVPLLFAAFLAEFGRDDLELEPETRALLEGAAFPGHVRELRNLAERLAHQVPEGPLTPAHIGELEGEESRETAGPLALLPYRRAMDTFERGWLEDLLERCDGNVAEAARQGGISRPSLHGRLSALGIDVDALRRRARARRR